MRAERGDVATNLAEGGSGSPPASALLASIDADGVASHPFLADDTAFAGAEGMRDLADVVHYLCILHGRHPGLIEHAGEMTTCAPSRAWLGTTAAAFADERLYVTRLAVAAGPVPSTPGSAQSEAAVAGQCHALRMLARSERRGCGLGAAIALVLDWRVLRRLLDRTAARLGVDVPPCRLPIGAEMSAMLDELGGDPAVRRALGFGAAQVLLQHRGLLDLLEARRSARRDG